MRGVWEWQKEEREFETEKRAREKERATPAIFRAGMALHVTFILRHAYYYEPFLAPSGGTLKYEN